MTTRILHHNVSGQDTPMYGDWHWRDTNKRKVIHNECAEEDVNHLQTFVVTAKRQNLTIDVYGKQVKLSNIVKTKQKGRSRWRQRSGNNCPRTSQGKELCCTTHKLQREYDHRGDYWNQQYRQGGKCVFREQRHNRSGHIFRR